MRVLMLGWEFPPFITGGLGTACFGLTKALDRRGIDVTFVLPKSVDRETASHVTLVSPAADWMPGTPVASLAGRAMEGPARRADHTSAPGSGRGHWETDGETPIDQLFQRVS